jgi:mycofactocin biosynthetic radical S-adenosylmethionine protein MftC
MAVQVRRVYVHVTNACNLRCRYCYCSAGDALPDELSTGDFERLWPQVIALAPDKVILTGGEPLLRSDLFDLLAGLRDADPRHGACRCLSTNGCFLDRDTARRLVGLVDELRISVDALRDRHDWVRGAGSFDAAMRALETAHAVGFEPVAVVTVISMGVPDLADLLSLLVSRQIVRIKLNALRATGRAAGCEGWDAAPAAVHAALVEAWHQCFPDRPIPSAQPEPASSAGCGAGFVVNILPNGDVYPCHVLNERLFRCGNVRRDALADLCGSFSLLERLRRFDLEEVRRREPSLASRTRPGTCVGELYAATRALPLWREISATASLSDRRPRRQGPP